MAAPIALAKFQFKGTEYSKGVKAEMARRLNRATQYLKTKVQLNISVPADLIGPMPTPAEFPRAINRQLGKSIYAEVDEANLVGHVGAGRAASEAMAKIIMALEFGDPSTVVIRPKGPAKALKIPITPSEAMAIISASRAMPPHDTAITEDVFKMLTAGRRRKLRKAAGVIQQGGRYFLLRAKVTRGPIRQKSFLRRTLHEERAKIRSIMCAPLPAGISGNVSVEVATGTAQIGSGDLVPMWEGVGGLGFSK